MAQKGKEPLGFKDLAAVGGGGLRLSSNSARLGSSSQDMDKMNCILLTAFIILTLSCTSGYALRCYFCEQSPFLCRTNLTCSEEDDACLQIRMVNLRTYRCWKMSRCSKDVIAEEFSVDSFRHLCCQRDFCNKSPSLLVTTTPFGISTAVVVWMMSR